MGKTREHINEMKGFVMGSYGLVFQNLNRLLYITIPLFVLSALQFIVIYKYFGLALLGELKGVDLDQYIQLNLLKIIGVTFPLGILQFMYGTKILRTTHRLFILGQEALQDYHFIKWNKEDWRFLRTSLFFVFISCLFFIVGMILAMIILIPVLMFGAKALTAVLSREAVMILYTVINRFAIFGVVIFIGVIAAKIWFIQPARAMGYKMKIKEALACFKGHTQKFLSALIAVVFPLYILGGVIENFLPWFVSLPLSVVYGFIFSAVFIALISLFYKDLFERYVALKIADTWSEENSSK